MHTQHKEEMLRALNTNMNEEFRAVLQYICHRISAWGQNSQLAESFKTAALDEMSHMLYFSDLITQQGGTARFTDWKVDQSTNLSAMIEADLRLEGEARLRYTEQLALFNDCHAVAVVLKNVLSDEEDHEATFRRYLETISAKGI